MTKDDFEKLYGATKLDIDELLNIQDFAGKLHKVLDYMLKNPNIKTKDIWKEEANELKSNIKEKLIQQQIPKSPDELSIPKCFYCRRPLFSDMGFKSPFGGDIDHILDKSNNRYRYLMFSPFNLVLACRRCNFIKNTKDLLEKTYDFFSSNGGQPDEYKNEIYEINIKKDIINTIIHDPNFKTAFAWIHPYYDNYHECIEIFYPCGRDKKGRYNAILYRPHKNLPQEKRKKAQKMIKDLNLGNINGQEESALDIRIAFLWGIKNRLEDDILNTSGITQDETEKLLKSLTLSFETLRRNI